MSSTTNAAAPTTNAAAPTMMDPARRKRAGWVAAVMLTVMMVINWADKSVLGLAAGPIMADLGLTPTQFGAIGSIFFLVFCVTPLGVGFIANRVSSQWLMAALVLLWSVAQLPVLISASFATLLISRIVLGAAEGPSASLMHHHLHKWFTPTERAMPSSVGASGSTLGLAIAAPVLTFIIASFGWRAAMAFMAVVGLVWVAVWMFAGKDGPLRTYDAAEGERDPAAPAQPGADPRVSYLRILTTGTWLGGALASHLAYWALTIYATWLPIYLQRALGLDLKRVGAVAAIPPLVGFVTFIGSGAIVELLARRGISMRWSVGVQMGVTSAIAGAALLGAVNVAHSTATIVLLAVAFGVPNSALSLVFLSAARVSPVKQRGAVFAFTNVAFTCAGIAAPLVIGMVIERSASPVAGFETVFLVLGIAMVVGGALVAWLVHPERDAEKLGLTNPLRTTVEAPSALEPAGVPPTQ